MRIHPGKGGGAARRTVLGALVVAATAATVQFGLGTPPALAGSQSATAVAVTGDPIIATQGPDNTLWVYWETTRAQWYGPLGIGAVGSTYSSPAAIASAQTPPTVVAQGPDQSLWLYWEASNAQWYGPLGLAGPGTAWSAPSMAMGTTGPVVAVEGPEHTLWIYWEDTDAQWQGPLQIGAVGTTYSSPSLATTPSGLPMIAVQGPDNSLWVYQEDSSGQWNATMGVGSVGSTFSSPSLSTGPSGQAVIGVQGPADSLWVYWLTGGSWYGPLGAGAPGSTNSAPSVAIEPSGFPVVAVQGPSNTLWVYWEEPDNQWYGPLGAGAPGSTNSAPSVAVNDSGLPVVGVEGPSNALWTYWEAANNQWYGPLGPGAPGSVNGSADPGAENPAPSAPSALGNTIASLAVSMDGVSDDPASTNFAFDCNPFTTLLYPGMANPSCGYDAALGVQEGSEEWCADFAKWAWQAAGLTDDLNILTPSAATFYTWGQANGESMPTFSGSPQVGDAIVFFPPGAIGDYADHVGIVSAVNPNGTINIVNGDFLNGSNIEVEEDDDVLPGPYAAAIWQPGEQWVYVSP